MPHTFIEELMTNNNNTSRDLIAVATLSAFIGAVSMIFIKNVFLDTDNPAPNDIEIVEVTAEEANEALELDEVVDNNVTFSEASNIMTNNSEDN
ncbi:MAG: hypothetical protein CME38_08885 [Haliea sp.]|nr:hypothetical protein [Haliea sp.]|tara:strand:- start:680 stop:961 length:282 start_codon:yes stop_codon:yes gene_type:complete